MERRTAEYQREIRDYLVGRIGRSVTTGRIDRPRDAGAPPAPVLLWWMFEGKRYPGLEGALANNWLKIARMARRLLRSFSPRWRPLEVPEGRVDWVRTIQQNLGSHPSTSMYQRSPCTP